MWTLLLLAQSTPAHFLYACFLSTSLSFTTYIFFFTPISLIKVQIRWSSLTQTSVLSFVTLFTTFLPRVFRGIFWYISHLFVVSNVDSIFYANICKFAYSIESETAKLNYIRVHFFRSKRFLILREYITRHHGTYPLFFVACWTRVSHLYVGRWRLWDGKEVVIWKCLLLVVPYVWSMV